MRKFSTEGYEIINPSPTDLPTSPNTFQTSSGAIFAVPGLINGTAGTTLALTANRLVAMPFIVPRRITYATSLNVNVTTSATATNLRLGVYRNTSASNLYPSSLLYDSGDISSATTGVKTGAPGTPIDLIPGELYWFTVVSSGTPTIRALAVGGMYPLLGVDSGLGTALGVGWFVAITYGALPDPFTGGATVQTGTSPLIGLGLA